VKRVLLVVGIVVLAVVAIVGVVAARSSESTLAETVPGTACPSDSRNLIAAQSVPSATMVPCISQLSSRWTVTSESYTDDGTKLTLAIEEAPDVQWTVTFDEQCSTTEPSDDDRVFEFEGGCVSSTVTVPPRYNRQLIIDDMLQQLELIDRGALDQEVRDQTDGELQLDP
jgi:hypothetical protein